MSIGISMFSISDLIMVTNLLLKDAKEWESLTNSKTAGHGDQVITDQATDRRNLAKKFKVVAEAEGKRAFDNNLTARPITLMPIDGFQTEQVTEPTTEKIETDLTVGLFSSTKIPKQPVTLSDELVSVAMDATLLEVGRKAIETSLMEFRDLGISEMFRNNGLVIKGKDGAVSSIIRFGPETGLYVGLRAIAEHLKTTNQGNTHG